MPIDITRGMTPQSQGANERTQVKSGRNGDAPSSQATAGSGKTTGGDTVNLTQTASRLRELENQVANLPAVDSDRVEAVAKALADGNYEIDASRIAAKMLDFESALNG